MNLYLWKDFGKNNSIYIFSIAVHRKTEFRVGLIFGVLWTTLNMNRNRDDNCLLIQLIVV